jgi:small subunit ribosomal protein S1
MELGPPHEPAAYLERKLVFRILRLEDRGHRLVLSRAAMLREEKRQQAELLRRSLQVDQVVSVQVVALTDFGAFVDLGGIEGLIHISELAYGRVRHPSEVVKVGDRFDAKILKLPEGNERVSLSRKALLPDPWERVTERYAVGQKVKGRILRTTEFGVFVELEPGVEGLLHRSRLPRSNEAKSLSFEADTETELFVSELDPEKRRISLALEETPKEDPWSHVHERYPEGSVHEGTVVGIEKKGIVVELETGLSGLLPASHLSLPREAKLARVYPKGKKVKVQIASIDSRRRKILLVPEGKALEGNRSDYREYLKSIKKSPGLGTLASALGKVLRS